ncbi:MAG: tetratricopeptide repeat protein [Gemmatimonadota bacterium]|nr:tetratricopeptide repeat protein [Gemmatimonadota bacterium]MDH4350371.1 tetratricopeptide repeat protein [Gemmatimonadota bacterium]MDH5197003.1 tetratricopeptide repeat protein [Gemmatimonadota bacterium]
MRIGLLAAGIAVAMTTLGTDATGQGRAFVPPQCDVPKGHYLVSSAVLYLQNAGRTRFQDQRQRDLRDARRVLLEAITEKDQDQNGSAWYYLARYYQEMRDLVGADSAFDRAAPMLPDCAQDITDNRRRLWVPLLNAAVDRIKAGDNEGAIAQLREANAIFASEPPAFYYMGQIFANLQQRDSAIAYYDQALAIARRPENAEKEQYADIRDNAEFNIARIYHIDQKYDSAAAWYARFRQHDPTDAQATTGQASALESAGRIEEALALYDSVLIMSDSMSTLDLFQAGVALFRTRRLQRAAEAFERGLERNPHFRDALFNLANTYLSLANDVDSTLPKAEQERLEREYGEKMVPVVNRLVAGDPASTAALRLLAAALQLTGQPDSTLAVLERIEALPFEITISTFEPAGSSFDVRGIITNLRSEGTAVPAVTFEYLTEAGEVVQSIVLESRSLEPEGMAPIAMAPVGEGIAAWRYRVGS